jgi:hypothetical protein
MLFTIHCSLFPAKIALYFQTYNKKERLYRVNALKCIVLVANGK